MSDEMTGVGIVSQVTEFAGEPLSELDLSMIMLHVKGHGFGMMARNEVDKRIKAFRIIRPDDREPNTLQVDVQVMVPADSTAIDPETEKLVSEFIERLWDDAGKCQSNDDMSLLEKALNIIRGRR